MEGRLMALELDDIVTQEERERIKVEIRGQVDRLLKELGVEGVYIAALKVTPNGAWSIDDWFWPAAGGPPLDVMLEDRVEQIREPNEFVENEMEPEAAPPKGRLN
jgi:hypothetical protein